MSDVSDYLMVSAKSLCCDIMRKSVPGSPHPFLFFGGVRGEPGNEARPTPLYVKCQHPQCRYGLIKFCDAVQFVDVTRCGGIFNL